MIKFKKYLRIIGKTLLWILYVMLTAKDRRMYLHAKYRDREVLNVEDDLFGSTFTMGRPLFGREPERDFLTWKEFREYHKF